jgi:hypothetical protein
MDRVFENIRVDDAAGIWPVVAMMRGLGGGR